MTIILALRCMVLFCILLKFLTPCFFFSDIEKDDSFELRRALRNHEIDTVILASDGGSVREGLIMAGIIHDKSLKTYVPENLGCHSACAYMFFGGKIRRVDGTLGVHQTGFYGSEADSSSAKISDIQISTQYTVSEVIGFLNEFETPPWVYEKMFRSRELYEFDDGEKKRLALRSDEISEQKLQAINEFIESFFEYLENLEEQTSEPEENKAPELSEQEELRLVITEIQKLLNAAGCNAGVADGIWGRRTQAAAVLFAKTAKLPTTQDALISEAFIERLQNSSSDFCPKLKPQPKSQPKFLETQAPTKDEVTWVIRTRCNSRWNSQIVKGQVVRNSRHYWYSLDMDYAVSVLITHLKQSNFTFRSSNKRKPVRYRITMSNTGKRFTGTATSNTIGCTQIEGELQ
jgi:hypothetical protein